MNQLLKNKKYLSHTVTATGRQNIHKKSFKNSNTTSNSTPIYKAFQTTNKEKH